MNEKPLNKTQTLAYMKKGWVLEFCSGVTLGSNWVWIRPTPKSGSPIKVHANAAYALREGGLIEIDKTDQWHPFWTLKARATGHQGGRE